MAEKWCCFTASHRSSKSPIQSLQFGEPHLLVPHLLQVPRLQALQVVPPAKLQNIRSGGQRNEKSFPSSSESKNPKIVVLPSMTCDLVVSIRILEALSARSARPLGIAKQKDWRMHSFHPNHRRPWHTGKAHVRQQLADMFARSLGTGSLHSARNMEKLHQSYERHWSWRVWKQGIYTPHVAI